MSLSRYLYATDEDLALRAGVDYDLLCPLDQKLAEAADGRFESIDRWTLASASISLAASGLAAGHVVRLLGPSDLFPAPGELMTVEAISPAGIELRRLGLAPRTGSPPGPLAGATGVQFQVRTFEPQVRIACEDLDRRLGLNGNEPASPLDSQALRDLTVLTVLCGRYLTLSQHPGRFEDPMAAKASTLAVELGERLARLLLRHGHDDGYAVAARFATRIVR